MDLLAIQDALQAEHVDGWLFFDHHSRDPYSYRILGLDANRMATRRWYYLIPAKGEPRGLVHRVESFMLDPLPGEKLSYSRWQEQFEQLQRLLSGCGRIAMQYSPECAIFYISMVDGGTLELIRKTGVEIVSSANLVQQFEARWNRANLDRHLEAARKVDDARAAAFTLVADRLRAGERVTEYEVQQFIRGRFSRAGLVTDHGPIVAVNENASNPHYEPTAERNREIRRGDCLLIDMWAKSDTADGVYYDITWDAYCGPEPPTEVENVFGIVRDARNRAAQFVIDSIRQGRELRGFEVDDVARGHIREKGFADRFIHRTGHSIGADVHGAGANMDNLEIHDERRIIPWTCFSVEPGIYLQKFGIRSEINVFVGDREARVTGEAQDRLVLVA